MRCCPGPSITGTLSCTPGSPVRPVMGSSFPSVSQRPRCCHIIFIDEVPETFDRILRSFCTMLFATSILCEAFVAVKKASLSASWVRTTSQPLPLASARLCTWRLRVALVYVSTTRSDCLFSSRIHVHNCRKTRCCLHLPGGQPSLRGRRGLVTRCAPSEARS